MRGHIRKRGKRWYAIIDGPQAEATSKRTRKWLPLKAARKSDAEKELTELVGLRDKGMMPDDSKRLTVAQFLDQWLAARTDLAAMTHQRYGDIVRTQIKPALGSIRLTSLKPLDVQTAYGTWEKTGRLKRPGVGLSKRTILHHHRLIHRALKDALKWGLVARNVADAVNVPRPVTVEMKTLDASQLGAFLQSAQTRTRYAVAFELLVYTGARRGEVLGTRWADVDFEGGSIAIRRSLEQTRKGLAFKSTKSGKERRISLPSATLEALRRHRVAQAKVRLAAGEQYKNGDLIFAEDDGSPIVPHKLGDSFRGIARSLGFQDVHLHTLRHSHATALLQASVHPKTASARLGHSTVGVTMDLYTHALPALDRDAADGFAELLRTAAMPSEKAQ